MIKEDDMSDIERGDKGEESLDDTAKAASLSASSCSSRPDDEAPASSRPSIRKLVKLALPEVPALVMSLVLLIGNEGCFLLSPLVIARAYDAVIDASASDEQKSEAINAVMILVVALNAAGLALGWARMAIQGVAGERVVARLRLRLYRSIVRQEIAFFDEHKSGEIVSRLGSDATLLQTSVSHCLSEVVASSSKSVVCLVLMFYLSPPLAGLALASVLFILALSAPFGLRLGTLSKRYQDVLGDAQTRSTEVIGAMRTVQSFAAEDRECARYQHKIGDPDGSFFSSPLPSRHPSPDKINTYQVGYQKALTTSTLVSIIFGGGILFLHITLWYGFHLVNNNRMTVGDLTAFQSYVFNIALSAGQLASNFAKLLEGLGASGRMFYLMDRVPAIPKYELRTHDVNSGNGANNNNANEQLPITPETMEGTIQFKKVHFSYPSRPNTEILSNFSLTIPSNTTTALVGTSGAGKSTVVSLLQRFYDVASGSILIDGYDLRDLDLKWLRHRIGYVQQEPNLFGLSVKQNLLYGLNPEHFPTQEELEGVCRDANAHDFIMEMPQKYGTLVGERGVKLSGGQKQRIAIARALLTKCNLLLLDEATSALDAESEFLVQQAMDRAVVGRTVVVVAHRLSTVRAADQIVVMDDHKIVDTGTHEQLVQKCDKYRDLIKRQSVLHSTSS